MPLPVVYRDEHLIVLDKPSGLLSVPGRGPERADCLAARVAGEHPGARVVHRLDQDTSGIMLMALDRSAQSRLARQFQDRQVTKTYLAVAHGRVREEHGEIDLPLRADIDHRPHQIVDHLHGKPALSRYRVLARLDDRTRLELTPVTGRSHQLRVHLLAIGHPILGDDLYAPPAVLALADRLMLHAAALSITHPTSGERMTFTAACPF